MRAVTDGALWYFAYGSNLHRDVFLERRRMTPLAVRRGRLDGYQLRFNLPVGPGERGVANLEPEAGACTHGVLYLLSAEDCERLDRKPSERYLRLLLEGARDHGLPTDWVAQLATVPLARDERLEGPGMTARTVRFYFAYNSPYGFLASQRIAQALAGLDVTLEYKAVYAPRTGGPPDLATPRFRYLLEDVGRFADAYGLTLRPGPFADTRQACLGLFHARENGAERPYHDGVYRARWLEGRDIGDPTVLAGVAATAGLDPARFVAALDDPRHAAALEASNRDAQADEVFGFPYFLFAGQRFWGNDRVEWLVRAIDAGAASATAGTS